MPTITNPRPGNIQTIVVSKKPGIDLKKAKEKAIGAGARSPISNDLVDETKGTYRFRQRNPTDFVEGSFKSFKVPGQGVIIVYGKLKDKKMSEFRSIPFLLSEETFPSEVQLLRCGCFFHDGREIQITEDDLISMVKNFSEKIRGIDLMIDFSHKSEGEAAGWIKKLSLSEDNNQLWAEVEWTPEGKKNLENKSFKYISADFSFNYKDNEERNSHGPTLFGAGLTNRPVVKSMEPIILSEKNINQLSEVEKMQNDEEKKEEHKLDETQDLRDEIENLKSALLKKDEELVGLRSQLEEQKAKDEEALAELEREKVLAEKNKNFDKKLSEGLVVEAQRTPFIEGDMDKFLSLQHEIKLSESGSSKPPEAKLSKENFEDEILKLAHKRSQEDKIDLDVAIGIELRENKDVMTHYNSIA